MLSRVADSIFWMSRYVERAENVARFIDVNLHMMIDLALPETEQWAPLVSTTGDHEWFKEKYGASTEENVIRFLTFDLDYPNSILSCLRAARENARSVREIISSTMWEQLNKFYLLVRDAAQDGGLRDSAHDFYSEIKENSHLFVGVTDATMSHGEAWHFSRLGRLLERADKTSRILDVKYFILLPTVQDVGSPLDDLQWSAVLHSTSAFEMYRKRFGRILPKHVVEFLVLDREFPRAVHFCLSKADESLHAISGTPEGTFRNAAEQRLGQLRSELAYLQIDEIIGGGLHEFLDSLQGKMNLVGEAVYDTFFTLRPVAAAASQSQFQRG